MSKPDLAVVDQVAEHLKNYVYMLIDPRDGVPFYVGKGRGSRMQSHGAETTVAIADLVVDKANVNDQESAGVLQRKHQMTADIRSAGDEPEVWILRYGMGSEYTQVEAAAIDLLLSLPVKRRSSARPPLDSMDQLTNKRREASRDQGVIRLDQLIDMFAAPELATTEPLLLITLGPWNEFAEPLPGGGTRKGYGFKREWLDTRLKARSIDELGDSTRCWWSRISVARVSNSGTKHCVPVYGGVTRALFEIVPDSWHSVEKRRGFAVRPVTRGRLFDEVVGPHGHRVPARRRGDQNAYHYWPRG